MRKNENPLFLKKAFFQMCANDQPTAKTPPHSPKHHTHFPHNFQQTLFITTTTMPKTKPTYNGSSSDDDGSNYSDTARDESSDENSDDSSDDSSNEEEISANHHHRVYDDVNELKAAGEWRPGRGQLLGGKL